VETEELNDASEQKPPETKEAKHSTALLWTLVWFIEVIQP